MILVLHLTLGLTYSVVTPAWEATDEPGHYLYAQYLASHRALPPAGEVVVPRVGLSQGTHPPLYHMLVAIPIALFDHTEGEDFRLNRYAAAGTAEFGVNMTVHDFSQEAFPWSGQLLALHLGRAISVLLSTIGIYFVFLLARFLLPERPVIAAVAVAIAAFAPQYVASGSVINNDVMIAALGCVTFYYACRLALGEMRWADIAGLGISLGLALVTKNTAFGLVFIGVVALLIGGIREMRRHSVRRPLLGGLAIVLLVLLLAGWWIGHNLITYGVPRAARPEYGGAAPGRPPPPGRVSGRHSVGLYPRHFVVRLPNVLGHLRLGKRGPADLGLLAHCQHHWSGRAKLRSRRPASLYTTASARRDPVSRLQRRVPDRADAEPWAGARWGHISPAVSCSSACRPSACFAPSDCYGGCRA